MKAETSLERNTTMPIFTNRATLTYTGGVINSNTVTGQVSSALAVAKTALGATYRAVGDTLAYTVTLTNGGTVPLTGLSVTDDLGAYPFGAETLVPLTLVEDSVVLLINGVAQPTPTVTENPFTVSGITVPAGGNAVLIYRARPNGYAPVSVGGTVVNTVTVAGACPADTTASATVTVENAPDLSIEKSLCPQSLSCQDPITYTFTVRNAGNRAATATDSLVISDVFSPPLSDITVTYNGTLLVAGTDYTYDPVTGEFATALGVVTVPAATVTQDPETGLIITVPGESVLAVSGNLS